MVPMQYGRPARRRTLIDYPEVRYDLHRGQSPTVQELVNVERVENAFPGDIFA